MVKLLKKRSKKTGLPAGSLIHIGEKKAEKTKLTVISYDDSHVEEKEVTTVEECFPLNTRAAITWINVDGLHQPEILEKLGSHFGVHPLILEDILNTDQRSKLDDFEGYIFIVLKLLSYCDQRKEILTEQISLVLGKDFVLSFQEREGDIFKPVRERIRNGKGRIRKEGPDYLAYSLIDAIVDQYFIILEKLGETIEAIEEEVVTNPTSETLHAIYKLKREMISVRKSIWPLREVIGYLTKGESSLFKEYTGIFLKDIYDHTIQVMDTIETFRDIISGMLDIYLSSNSMRLNEVMKVLTMIATIFIPLTFIAGVYGMNFKYMPALEWRGGYFLVICIMLIIGISMLFYFRKKKWL